MRRARCRGSGGFSPVTIARALFELLRRESQPRRIKGAREIYYPGTPHGLTATRADQVNRDSLGFIRG